ncbi:hypothetical protein BBJ29_001879 [Phytophthora kernoviae]|uniref:Uncharacterized protein n=1 Tax=Phytophthora kernoviae TaxID=325452 RepID=A0A3F2RPY4_9STRA|nr:hypothetical protein BBJ29_001879 [Phytophthora kernoviae]RLN61958.1 hypothetical protein BBP00_00005069 [Phytophthora kernoviae]
MGKVGQMDVLIWSRQGAALSNLNTMPPLVATTECVKPFTPTSTPVKDRKEQGFDFFHGGWIEKVHGAQEHQTDTRHSQSFKFNIIQRTLASLSFHKHHAKHDVSTDDKPHNYKKELQKYIAESTANLYYDEEPQDSLGDDSDIEMDPPRHAEIIDFSESIVSIDSVSMDEYVVPPVEVPRTYRTQDRHGGVLVAGDHVTFTNWAFKRQLRRMGNLGPIPERSLTPVVFEAQISEGMYSGKIVEL